MNDPSAAADLCRLLLLQAAPALALDPALARYGWSQLADSIAPTADRDRVAEFVTSDLIREWASHMRVLDDPDRSDEWDEFWSSTLILADVVIGAIAVFDGASGWEGAIHCEAFVDLYRERLGHRGFTNSLSDACAKGAAFEDLAAEAMDRGRAWAQECRSQHEQVTRPWPPAVLRIPPPRS